jgi:hypothetical protein
MYPSVHISSFQLERYTTKIACHLPIFSIRSTYLVHIIVDLVTQHQGLEDRTTCFVTYLQAVWLPASFAKIFWLNIYLQAPSICFLPSRPETRFQTLRQLRPSLFWDVTWRRRMKASTTPRRKPEVSHLQKCKVVCLCVL